MNFLGVENTFEGVPFDHDWSWCFEEDVNLKVQTCPLFQENFVMEDLGW